jgi:hypothetical protein
MPSLQNGALELLLSADEKTRLRGSFVLVGIASAHFGRVQGQEWNDTEAESRWNETWKRNGSYDYESSASERISSYLLWKKWVESVAK